jgi:hypothetical protein
MQTLRKFTIHALLAVIVVYAGLICHRLFLVDQDIENGVEFQQQIFDTLNHAK